MSTLDHICEQCPLLKCDERSLWCVHRLLTRPNAAQKAVISRAAFEKKGRSRKARRRYYREYYMKNRPEKLAAANARHARIREEQNVTQRETL
jgi:hypothetical protein